MVPTANSIASRTSGSTHAKRGVELRLRHQDAVGRNVGLVELAREARERLVALGLHRGDDRPDLLEERRRGRNRRASSALARWSAESLASSWKLQAYAIENSVHFDFRKMSRPTRRSSAATAIAATTTKTTEIAARSGVMIERIEL